MAIPAIGDYPQARAMLQTSRPLTPGERAALADELTADPAGRGYREAGGTWKPTGDLFGLLNDGYSGPNPAPAPEVPRHLVDTDLLGLLSPASQKRIVNYPNLPVIIGQIEAQNRAQLTSWAQVLAAGEIITPEETGALLGYINSTVPDPAWPPTVMLPGRAQTVAGVVVEMCDITGLLEAAG